MTPGASTVGEQRHRTSLRRAQVSVGDLPVDSRWQLLPDGRNVEGGEKGLDEH
jgi:hypothetical protein